MKIYIIKMIFIFSPKENNVTREIPEAVKHNHKFTCEVKSYHASAYRLILRIFKAHLSGILFSFFFLKKHRYKNVVHQMGFI